MEDSEMTRLLIAVAAFGTGYVAVRWPAFFVGWVVASCLVGLGMGRCLKRLNNSVDSPDNSR